MHGRISGQRRRRRMSSRRARTPKWRAPRTAPAMTARAGLCARAQMAIRTTTRIAVACPRAITSRRFACTDSVTTPTARPPVLVMTATPGLPATVAPRDTRTTPATAPACPPATTRTCCACTAPATTPRARRPAAATRATPASHVTVALPCFKTTTGTASVCPAAVARLCSAMVMAAATTAVARPAVRVTRATPAPPAACAREDTRTTTATAAACPPARRSAIGARIVANAGTPGVRLDASVTPATATTGKATALSARPSTSSQRCATIWTTPTCTTWRVGSKRLVTSARSRIPTSRAPSWSSYLQRDVTVVYHTGHGFDGAVATSNGSINTRSTVIHARHTIFATCLTLADTSVALSLWQHGAEHLGLHQDLL